MVAIANQLMVNGYWLTTIGCLVMSALTTLVVVVNALMVNAHLRAFKHSNG